MINAKDPVFVASVENLKKHLQEKRQPMLDVFKRFRKLNESRLLMAHNAGGGGRELARYRASLVDVILRELADRLRTETHGSTPAEPLVVAAFGGYGRREMNPFSDVDITFITQSNQPRNDTEEFIRRFVMMLWDMGFKVGHSVRSVSQAVQQANQDMLTKTSMLECRYLLGQRELFQEFQRRFQHDCVRGQEKAYLAWREAKIAEQREKFGASVYMQEPNVKSGCGGLRDYQNLLWIACFAEGVQSMSKMVERKFLRESERHMLEKGYDFLLRVRTQMHYLNKRPNDQLTLQMQGRVATAFGYPQKHILRRCEAFMREYYQAARSIHLTTEAALARLNPPAPRSTNRLLGLFVRQPKEEKFDGLIAREGQLFAQSNDIFQQDRERLMRVFFQAQSRKLALSPSLRDLIRRRLPTVDRTFQYGKANREVFLSILSHKGEVGRILREMHDTGFLGKYLPEFEPLTCLVQHEFFHRYTVDEHTLVCVEKLDAVLFTEEPRLSGYRKLLQKQDDPAVLYLALLLHDTGKSTNRRGHEEASAELAQKAARRLQLSPDRRRMLISLVNNHYELSHTAQTRNLEDEATVKEFCSIVQNVRNLDALMLLTLADGMGTSDEKWSDWKESLVWSLYGYARSYLESGSITRNTHRENLQEARALVLAKLPKDFEEEVSAHFQHMPERYFACFDPDAMRGHLRLFRKFFERMTSEDPLTSLQPAVEWIDRPSQGHTEVRLCGWDRDTLLERIAGAFVAGQINILSADAFTRGDSMVLDIFRVCDTRHQPVSSPKDREKFEALLAGALQHTDYDFSPFFEKDPPGMKFYRLSHEAELPSRITIQNTLHPIYSLVEIQTPDRLGLLYDLLRALGQAGVSIELSRITTEMDVAIDTFYVTTKEGRKVTDQAQMERLKEFLQRAAIRERKDVGDPA